MRYIILLFLFSFLISSAFAEDIEQHFEKLLDADHIERQVIIREIVEANPSFNSIIDLINNIEFNKYDNSGILLTENMCIDGISRPYYLYIPESYNFLKKSPLIVYLHGGVGREEIIDDEDFREYINENPFVELAEKNNYILLFPTGQIDALWWDSVGVANILTQIYTTKKYFNIDDNKVFMTGFSDGASGSFFFAMCHPTTFTGFIPLNGHPGVGSIDGGIHTYFINLFNSPLHVINTDLDPLYPGYKIKDMLDVAINAGADLIYKIYIGICHSFDYAEAEMPIIEKFINYHSRITSKPHIKWECADQVRGRCFWISIDKIDSTGHESWYSDHNIELIDDRIIFGFYADQEYEGDGIRVAGLVDNDSTLCNAVGIIEGDIFIKLDTFEIHSMEDMGNYKETKNRGDSTEIIVKREDEEITIIGKFPDPEYYMLFRREKASARVESNFSANTFTIKGSQVGAFSIFIDPNMVRLDQKVKIYFNDELVFDDFVEPDIEFYLNNFLETFDRELIYINKISVDLL